VDALYQETVRCKWCSSPANDPRYHVAIGAFSIALCPTCFIISKQLVSNLARIREQLAKDGIHIGIVKDN